MLPSRVSWFSTRLTFKWINSLHNCIVDRFYVTEVVKFSTKNFEQGNEYRLLWYHCTQELLEEEKEISL